MVAFMHDFERGTPKDLTPTPCGCCSYLLPRVEIETTPDIGPLNRADRRAIKVIAKRHGWRLRDSRAKGG